jgi:hypothetical protein
MACFQCGNCNGTELLYYCTARNEFVIREGVTVTTEKKSSHWKKGDPVYESRRRLRKEKEIS